MASIREFTLRQNLAKSLKALEEKYTLLAKRAKDFKSLAKHIYDNFKRDRNRIEAELNRQLEDTERAQTNIRDEYEPVFAELDKQRKLAIEHLIQIYLCCTDLDKESVRNCLWGFSGDLVELEKAELDEQSSRQMQETKDPAKQQVIRGRNDQQLKKLPKKRQDLFEELQEKYGFWPTYKIRFENQKNNPDFDVIAECADNDFEELKSIKEKNLKDQLIVTSVGEQEKIRAQHDQAIADLKNLSEKLKEQQKEYYEVWLRVTNRAERGFVQAWCAEQQEIERQELIAQCIQDINDLRVSEDRWPNKIRENECTEKGWMKAYVQHFKATGERTTWLDALQRELHNYITGAEKLDYQDRRKSVAKIQLLIDKIGEDTESKALIDTIIAVKNPSQNAAANQEASKAQKETSWSKLKAAVEAENAELDNVPIPVKKQKVLRVVPTGDFQDQSTPVLELRSPVSLSSLPPAVLNSADAPKKGFWSWVGNGIASSFWSVVSFLCFWKKSPPTVESVLRKHDYLWKPDVIPAEIKSSFADTVRVANATPTKRPVLGGVANTKVHSQTVAVKENPQTSVTIQAMDSKEIQPVPQGKIKFYKELEPQYVPRVSSSLDRPKVPMVLGRLTAGVHTAEEVLDKLNGDPRDVGNADFCESWLVDLEDQPAVQPLPQPPAVVAKPPASVRSTESTVAITMGLAPHPNGVDLNDVEELSPAALGEQKRWVADQMQPKNAPVYTIQTELNPQERKKCADAWKAHEEKMSRAFRPTEPVTKAPERTPAGAVAIKNFRPRPLRNIASSTDTDSEDSSQVKIPAPKSSGDREEKRIIAGHNAAFAARYGQVESEEDGEDKHQGMQRTDWRLVQDVIPSADEQAADERDSENVSAIWAGQMEGFEEDTEDEASQASEEDCEYFQAPEAPRPRF